MAAEAGKDRPTDDARSRPPATVTPYRNGPYLLRGDFRILGPDGEEIPVTRRTVALCRCGGSSIKPFCDGTHKLIGFKAPGGTGPDPSSSDRQAGTDEPPSGSGAS